MRLLVAMSSSESTTTCGTSDTEYPDHVHECLKYVPIYRKGAFSCGSSLDGHDDDDDECGDEDVKRILAGHNEREPDDRETVDFSPAYEAAAAAAVTCGRTTVAADDYEDWKEAARDVSALYPPLGVGDRVVGRRATSAGGGGLRTSELADDDDSRRYRCCFDGDRGPADGGQTTARELRKCLEGALYGQDLRDFVVAQPFCVANKNLDFGKSKMSQRAMRDSRKKVENWMSKYVDDQDATTAAYLYH